MAKAILPGTLIALAVIGLGGCSHDNESYFPLGQKQVLTYDVVERRSNHDHHRKFITQYAGPLTLALADGGQIAVYQWLTAAGPRGLIQMREDGIYLVANTDSERQPVLREPATLLMPMPLDIGSRWTATTTSELLEWRKHTLEAADRNPAYSVALEYECRRVDAVVRTPAGTFTGVAEIHGSGERRIEIGGTRELSTIHVEITEWYAPGIGLVQHERKESTDNQLLNPGMARMVLERID